MTPESGLKIEAKVRPMRGNCHLATLHEFEVCSIVPGVHGLLSTGLQVLDRSHAKYVYFLHVCVHVLVA